MCECYQIGGRFIAEDPDCPVHGTAAQEDQREREADRADILRQFDELRAEVAAMRTQAGISWDGHSVRGDAKSIGEVRRLIEFSAARKVRA